MYIYGNEFISVKVEEEKVVNIRQAHEDEDTSDIKVLNALTEDIDKLNISTKDEDEDTYQERGPTGGVAVQPGLMMNKNIPVGPMSNYMPPQMPYTGQVVMKGNRRTLDDAENQPNKFFRPPTDYGEFNNIQLQQGFQFPNQQQQNFSGCFTGSNDLSQNMGQPIMNSQQYGLSMKPNFAFGMDQSMTTTKMVSSTKMSGGTVQSPVSSGPGIFSNNIIADDLLAEIDRRPGLPVTQGNLPNFASAAGQFSNNFDDNLFNSKSFKEIRRPSDPDSGVDSDAGSPWSEQAPSPSSSTYTSPPSVESGYGQSPMHESQSLHGSSPPKYPGVTSPGGYRTTPSPANTSGYGSPGQPQLDDADTFDNELLDDAMAVINEDLFTDELKRNQKPVSISRQNQLPLQALPTQALPNNLSGTPIVNPNQPMPQTNMVPVMMAPNQVQPMTQMLPPQPVTFPVTTANTSAPQQIIILQGQPQTSQSPVIFLPVQQNPPPQTKKTGTQYKKILPKISQPNNSSASAAGINTTPSGSKAGGTVSNSRSTPNSRAGAQPSTQGKYSFVV